MADRPLRVERWSDQTRASLPDAAGRTRVTFDPTGSDYQISLSVLNLSDKFYWSQLSTATARNGTPSVARSGNPGRPREWSIQFRKNFSGL